MHRGFFVTGAVLAGLAVLLGAFGAHGLEARVPAERLDTFETGVRYHMYHALALLLLGLAAPHLPGWQASWAGYLFVAGIAIFSGSLYVLVLSGVRWWGAVTPIGGIAFIAGWVLLAWSAWRGA